MKKNKDQKKLVILDAHALIHRSYHALASFNSPTGEPIGAVYGVSAVLIKLIRELSPTHIAAAFDREEPTFRHIAYEDYKGTRAKTDKELISQFNKVKEIFEAFKIPILEVAGFEADDVIGTLTELYKKEKDLTIVIASGDMDTLQLVRDEKVVVYTLRKGIEDTIIYNEEKVIERFGFTPGLIPDFKGLKGDPSDNIIGVKGIGEKTATEIIKEYGTIEDLYKRIKKEKKHPAFLKERILKLLLENEEEALFSKELALIRRDTPISPSLDDLIFPRIPVEEVTSIFRRFHFPSLISRLPVVEADKKETAEYSLPDLDEIKKADEIFLYYDGENPIVGTSTKSYLINNPKKILDILSTKEKIIAVDAKKFFHFFDGYFPVADDLRIAYALLNPEERDFNLREAIAQNNIKDNDLTKAVSSLRDRLTTLIKREKLEQIYYEVELPLIKVLFLMEKVGVMLDRPRFKELEEKTKEELKTLEEKIWGEAGTKFDIASPKQLGEILFDKLKLSTKGIKKTSGKKISTKFSELLKLQGSHPIIDLVIRYREISKLFSTYISVFPNLIASDGRLHTTYGQTGAATGRLSSNDPNLQNIPIRTEAGREIRKAFIATSGYDLVSFDYSQLELRLAAFFWGDEKMTEAFTKGEDIHTRTAAEIFNVASQKVTPEMRRRAKTINFGILYGMGSRALAANLKISEEEASTYLGRYWEEFKGIKEYKEKVVHDGVRDGYVKTLFGRRRYLPNLRSRFEYIKSEAERVALNAPIQGTEADLVKIAMVEIFKELGLDSIEGVRMLLQVHDELLFEITKNKVKELAPRIKKIMERVDGITIPIVVDAKFGPNWQDMKPL